METANLVGTYTVECISKDGTVLWTDKIVNTVMTEGKNLALDTILAGAAYTVTGPFMGLISGTSFTSIAAADTAAQINGTNAWKEAGSAFNPTYTAPRKTAVYNAASAGSKALTAALSFAITSTGPDTVKGAFIVYGSGATSTIANTGGKLLSAGLFTGGDKSVSNGDTLNISWSLAM